MARSIWNGVLSFGLVQIPVGVYPAVRDSRPRFRMLHAKDKSPISMERVCQKDGKPVPWSELVKGYEYEKGRFVVLTKEDIAAAALEKTRRIDILDFVEAGSIDDRFFDTPYYLTPGKGGDKAYALLREAIRGSNRIGIGKFLLREVQHLAAVEAIDDALVITTLRFSEELVDESTLDLPQGWSHRQEGTGSREDAGRKPGRRVGAREVQGRLPRKPDARDQVEDEGHEGEAGGGGSRARLQRRGPDGTAAPQPRRRQRRSHRRAKASCGRQDDTVKGPGPLAPRRVTVSPPRSAGGTPAHRVS